MQLAHRATVDISGRGYEESQESNDGRENESVAEQV